MDRSLGYGKSDYKSITEYKLINIMATNKPSNKKSEDEQSQPNHSDSFQNGKPFETNHYLCY